jgi:hypothetical protein
MDSQPKNLNEENEYEKSGWLDKSVLIASILILSLATHTFLRETYLPYREKFGRIKAIFQEPIDYSTNMREIPGSEQFSMNPRTNSPSLTESL